MGDKVEVDTAVLFRDCLSSRNDDVDVEVTVLTPTGIPPNGISTDDLMAMASFSDVDFNKTRGDDNLFLRFVLF